MVKVTSGGFTWVDLFAVFGIAGLFAHSVTMYYTFLRAFFHGYRTLVTVNGFNEAWFEFVFIPVTLLWGLWGIIHFFRRITNDCPVCGCEMIYRFGYGSWCPSCHHRIHADGRERVVG